MEDEVKLKCKCGCGRTFYPDEEKGLDRWEYEYYSYECFHNHIKPNLKKLARKYNLTIDQLKNLCYDADDLYIFEWFPIERHNPDQDYKREQTISLRKSGIKIGKVIKINLKEW